MSEQKNQKCGAEARSDSETLLCGISAEKMTCATIAAVRTEKTVPDSYRLARKPDGTLVLQGAYMWQEGLNNHGYEWREIPTVDVDA